MDLNNITISRVHEMLTDPGKAQREAEERRKRKARAISNAYRALRNAGRKDTDDETRHKQKENQKRAAAKKSAKRARKINRGR
jgi:hypothetical protein